jgi:hypothetical protein
MPTSLRPLTTPGTYIQGQLATFIITTIKSSTEPAGFDHPRMRIVTTDDTTIVMEDTPMMRAPESYYYLDWEVPIDIEPGQYKAVFSSDLLDQTFEKVQYITIIANTGDRQVGQRILNSTKENELMVGLYYMIKETQEIPVENEQAKITSNGLKAVFTFKKWNIFYNKTRVYRNNEIMTSGYTIDYDNGEVIFDNAISEFDTINADYNFSWFGPEEFSWFLNLALQEINVVPPGSLNTLGNAPVTWYPGIIYGGAINALRRLIHDLSYQQPQMVYGIHADSGQGGAGGGGGGAGNGLENFKYLKENYEKVFDELKVNIKRQQWPSIALIVAPEFTMPGGRSRWFRYLFKG